MHKSLVLYPLSAVLAGLGALIGCVRTPPVAPRGGERVQVGLQQPVAYPDARAPELTLAVADIREGRCPRGASCLWAGEVRVTFALADRAGARQAVALRLFGARTPADTAEVQANGHRYRLVLHEVLPYPDLTRPLLPQDPRVVFSVQRR
jgi:hypothetical protein